MSTRCRTPFLSNALTPRPQIYLSDRGSDTFDAIGATHQSASQGTFFNRKSSKSSKAKDRSSSKIRSKSKFTIPSRHSDSDTKSQSAEHVGSANRNTNQDEDHKTEIKSLMKPKSPSNHHVKFEKDAWKSSHPTGASCTPESRGFNDRVKQQRNAPMTRGGLSSIRVKKPTAVNQGHTADLCWFMRTQQAEGAMVPTEFSSCVIHPALVDQPETPTSLRLSALKCDSLGSLKSSNKHTSTSSCSSTADSSSQYAFVSSRDSAVCSSTWVESERSPPTSPSNSSTQQSPCKQQVGVHSPIFDEAGSPLVYSSKTINFLAEEEDPFLYIFKSLKPSTKYAKRHSSATWFTTVSSPISPPCTCTATHTCNTYLQGPPSQHCHSCRLPLPRPEILAAMGRIEQAQKALAEDPDAEDEMMKNETFKALRNDFTLTEDYEVEMEERCSKGVWWEGWKVVRELCGESETRRG